MKRLIGLMSVLGLLAWGVRCNGSGFYKLPQESKADMGATHVAVITYADFSAYTATNGSTYVMSNLCTLAEKQGVEMVAMMLVTPFHDSVRPTTNASVMMQVGDLAETNLYLQSTQLDSDGTEVYLQYGRATQQLYTAANKLCFSFTGSAAPASSLSAMDSGEVRVYFRIRDAALPAP
jgi:hypothetical protein